MEKGFFYVRCRDENNQRPIENARITISFADEPDSVVMELTTNSSGLTDVIELEAPNLEFSQEPSAVKPYSEYTITVNANGYESVVVSGNEILPEVTAFVEVEMLAITVLGGAESIVIPEHTLYGDYPPKIAETEIKTVNESGEIVLSRVVVPEYIIVHDGPPTDSKAKNYYVKYKDYIKNVASSEIYATWKNAAIVANILAIMSFTLNRIYTEWYRNKGYDFNITSSTAYDHKWIYGRNLYSNISQSVDSVFNNYLSRPNVTQPILTQYCDGQKVTCPKWMSQWGSKYLADKGYSAIEILRSYYGDSIYINSAKEISGIPSSFPGYNLRQGSTGEKVKTLQRQLNKISSAYPLIPKLTVDGVFGPGTKKAVSTFQQVFGLPASGIVDFPTWYKISEIYVGVSRIAELV